MADARCDKHRMPILHIFYKDHLSFWGTIYCWGTSFGNRALTSGAGTSATHQHHPIIIIIIIIISIIFIIILSNTRAQHKSGCIASILALTFRIVEDILRSEVFSVNELFYGVLSEIYVRHILCLPYLKATLSAMLKSGAICSS